jgi:FkbM family methyltransferase
MRSSTAVSHELNRQALHRIARWAQKLNRVRPTVLVNPIIRFFGERKIVEVEGLKLYLDPTSHLGQSIFCHGTYEPETIKLFRDNVMAGDVVLDIGANEGFFSALGAQLVGEQGLVVAVEPQSRLMDVLEINLALNRAGETKIIQNVVGETDGETVEIALFPTNNTGASSLVRRYRFGANSQSVQTITATSLLEQAGRSRIDFVKVDVEGYEPEVVRSLMPLLQAGQVGKLLLDYHGSILKMRGIDPRQSHDLIVSCGYAPVLGTVDGGYVLYALN